MIIDFQSPFPSEVITYPDYTFTPPPPQDPVETIIIRGTTTGTSRVIGGTADQKEN